MPITLDQYEIDDAHQRLNLDKDTTFLEFAVPGPGASVVFLHFVLEESRLEAFLKEHSECIDVELEGCWTSSEDIPDGSFSTSGRLVAIRYILAAA